MPPLPLPPPKQDGLRTLSAIVCVIGYLAIIVAGLGAAALFSELPQPWNLGAVALIAGPALGLAFWGLLMAFLGHLGGAVADGVDTLGRFTAAVLKKAGR